MTSANSIVILTGDGPEHKYVTNLICSQFAVSAIFIVGKQTRSRSAIFRRGAIAFLDKLLWRVFLFAVNDSKARSEALRKVLGSQCLEFSKPSKLIHVSGDDIGGLARAVGEFHPGVIAVYGTRKIPETVLKQASEIALNMHTGLSPCYRGTACAFWPIAEGDAGQVGATVHQCTSDLDGGKIYFSGRAKLYRDDDLHAIFARAVKVGARGYVDVLHTLFTNRLTGRPQDLTIGREYRGYMRGIRAEIKARYNVVKMRSAWSVEEAGSES